MTRKSGTSGSVEPKWNRIQEPLEPRFLDPVPQNTRNRFRFRFHKYQRFRFRFHKKSKIGSGSGSSNFYKKRFHGTEVEPGGTVRKIKCFLHVVLWLGKNICDVVKWLTDQSKYLTTVTSMKNCRFDVVSPLNNYFFREGGEEWVVRTVPKIVIELKPKYLMIFLKYRL